MTITLVYRRRSHPRARVHMKKSPPPADALLHANPETVVWGSIPADKPPVLRIRSGQTVHIETISQQPISRAEPVSYFAADGITQDQILPEVISIYRQVKRAAG